MKIGDCVTIYHLFPKLSTNTKRAVHNEAATTATLGTKTTNVLLCFTAVTKYLFGDRG